MKDRTPYMAGLLLAILVLVVYYPILGYGFVGLDDAGYVTNNPRVLHGLTLDNLVWALTATDQANWHPLTWISLMIDAEIWGGGPSGFHRTNLLLHLAATLMLALALTRMTGRIWRSAVVAALFAIHPLHVESVAWIAERKDVLSGLFWMLTLVAYARYAQRPTTSRYVATAACFALGLMAKPMVVSLPLILLLLDRWPLGRVRRGVPNAWVPRIREKLPFFAMSAISCAVTLYAQSSAGSVGDLERFPVGSRIANAAVSYVGYLVHTAWPAKLAVPYPYPYYALSPLNVAGSLAVLAAVSLIAHRFVRDRPYLTLGWVWYLVTLVPVIGLVQVGLQAMADRYTYLPLIGIFIAIVWAVSDVSGALLPDAGRRRVASAAMAAAVILALSATTRAQLGHWRSATSLFEHALQVSRNNPMAHTGLGIERYRQGQLHDAEEQFRAALAVRPDYVEAHVNLAAVLTARGLHEQAIDHYRQAMAVRPIEPEILKNLAGALARQGMFEEAEDRLDAAIRYAPDDAELHRSLGSLLARRREDRSALSHFQRALDLAPRDVDARIGLATALMRLGRLQEAEVEYVEALRLDAGRLDAHKNLGVVLSRQGRFGEAIAEFERALRIDPQDRGALRNLERARELLQANPDD